ncbi:hypothetical protein CI102_6549 [Trichoderma harzianum]|nr:hypothetical protein CI102_6549 [Trichoderma harzianum]
MRCASPNQQLRSSLQASLFSASSSSSSSAIYPISRIPCSRYRHAARILLANHNPWKIASKKELILDKTTRHDCFSADDGIGITSAEFTSHTGFKHGTSPRLVFGLCSSRLRSRGFVAEQLPVRQLRQPRQPRPDIKHKVGKSTSTCH